MKNESYLETLSVQLGQILKKQGKTITCAESCTGGWIAKVLTDIAGSSDYFHRGFVTYSNEAKHQMIGVTEASLQKYGAVSEQVVSEMALGALKEAAADVAVSVSGIAGPGGGSEENRLVLFGLDLLKNTLQVLLILRLSIVCSKVIEMQFVYNQPLMHLKHFYKC